MSNTKHITADDMTCSVTPLHEVRDHVKLQTLAESMDENGWSGRPVLVLGMGNELQAITGSHRIAAAEEAGVEIPVVIIDVTAHVCDEHGNCVVCGDECRVTDVIDARDDDDRLSALHALGDERAVILMEAELDE